MPRGFLEPSCFLENWKIRCLRARHISSDLASLAFAAGGKRSQMNNTNNGPNHHTACDVIAAQIDPFIAGLKAAGYAVNTLCTKRAALRQFVSWRRSLKPSGSEPDE
jgi:hypothetical protein